MANTSEAKPADLAAETQIRRVLMEGPGEEAFDRLARLTARILKTPVALVTLVEPDRQVFRGCLGLPEPWQTWRETPLTHSFCRHVVSAAAPLIVTDAPDHPLVRDNPAIRDLNIVAYLGVPLIRPDGMVLGTFCVADSRPREWTSEEVETLQLLASCVMTEIELHAAIREIQEHAAVADREHAEKEAVQSARREAEAALALLDTLYRNAPTGLVFLDQDLRVIRINSAAANAAGCLPGELIRRRLSDVAPDLWAQIREPVEKALENTGGFDFEISTQAGSPDALRFWQTSVSAVRVPSGATRGIHLTLVDITDRRQAEESLRRQNRALVALAKDPVLTAGNLNQALHTITELAARTLGVRRVGIWKFNSTYDLLCCEFLYDLERGQSSPGLAITADAYPRYFQALEEDRVIAAHDAFHDPRTSELSTTYLEPQGVGALLDAPIHKESRTIGVVCHEHSGPARRWTPEEQNFAAGIADLVAMAYEHAERRLAEQALEDARDQLLRSEVEKKRFTRDLLRAVTQGKLHLVDADEIPDEGPWLWQLRLDEPTHYRQLRLHLQEVGESAGLDPEKIDELVLAAGEAATNAIKHANGGEAALLVTPEKIVVRVWDEGPGIRTEDLPASVFEAGYSTKVSLGMGFTLLLQLVDVIWLATSPRGTELQLEKRLRPEAPVDPLAAVLGRFNEGWDD